MKGLELINPDDLQRFNYFQESKTPEDLQVKIMHYFQMEFDQNNLENFIQKFMSDDLDSQHYGIIGIRKCIVKYDESVFDRIIKDKNLLAKIFSNAI